MSRLVINKHIITSSIEDILKRIREITNNKYCRIINKRGNNVSISCPYHKDGQEHRPSCYVYANEDGEIPYGYFRCFTCGSSGQLYSLVSTCLNISIPEAKQWLVDNFSDTFEVLKLDLPEIELGKETKEYLDESILDKYAYFHPYQFQRGLTEEVIRKFKVGYDGESDSITFPVWDEHNHLVGITMRSVKNKKYYIPSEMNKPIYLLNYIEKENIKEVVVCESQINALTCWSWGIPAIALFGTGSKSQYKILNKCGIRNFHLAFDGDYAGSHGAINFIKNISNDRLVDVIQIPHGKDVNDLTKEEFLKLEKIDKNLFTTN